MEILAKPIDIIVSLEYNNVRKRKGADILQRKEFQEKSFDGTILRVVKAVPENSTGVVVVVHGLAEHLGRYEELAAVLNESQLAVYRFDHRGHGKSEGPRAYYRDFNEIIEDVNVVFELARKENPGLPVFVLGHSMGGFAAACFGTKYPDKAAGIILSGALTRDNRELLQGVAPELSVTQYLPNSLGNLICTDQAVVKAYMEDPLVLMEVSVGLFRALLAGIEWLKEHKRQFTAPALLLHGCEDQLVSEQDSRELFGDIASTDKELKIYAKLYHEILNEPRHPEIMAEIVSWINKHL